VQICWIWQKVSSYEDKGFQRFLDNVQYKSNGILRYERVFGQGYVSTGGIGMLPFHSFLSPPSQLGEKAISCLFLLSLKLQPESQAPA
jgi:hypothetical protein